MLSDIFKRYFVFFGAPYVRENEIFVRMSTRMMERSSIVRSRRMGGRLEKAA